MFPFAEIVFCCVTPTAIAETVDWVGVSDRWE